MNRRNTSGFTLVEIMVVVVIVGLLAALAIPAFQRVRASSVDKAVMNNLRQLAGAAEQYYMEHGITAVASSILIGQETTQYIKVLHTVANESYSENFTLGQPLSASGIAGSRTISYLN
ncbi:pilus assembly protein [Verrucomicrobia bacterium IMCC26134]|jgi:type IV pilus assembly protein PilA|nr:pilus assembly protein [Verrucomicrobia bacterium IMCC26134]